MIVLRDGRPKGHTLGSQPVMEIGSDFSLSIQYRTSSPSLFTYASVAILSDEMGRWDTTRRSFPIEWE